MRSSILRAAQRLSAVHRGVAFEQRSLDILQTHLSMSLQKVGGKSDGGVDLQGWWWVPCSTHKNSSVLFTNQEGETRRRLRILGQCKAEKKKIGPNYVREMEGVLHRHNNDDSDPVVALLVSQSAFTRSTVLRAFSSPIPFFLLHLPPLPMNEGEMEDGAGDEYDMKSQLGAIIWNAALSGQEGVLGGEIEARWERSCNLHSGRPGLWWKGKKLKGWVPPNSPIDQN